jgi:hypothetical protein
MFWRKNREVENLAKLKERLGALVPEPVVSIATLGIDGSITDTPVDFVFLLLENENAEQFRTLVSKAIETAAAHKAIVVANAGGLIQLAVGPRAGDAGPTTYGVLLARELVQLLGGSVRVAYGRTIAHVGTVGIESRKNWGFFPLRIGPILRALLDATPGVPVDLGGEECG